MMRNNARTADVVGLMAAQRIKRSMAALTAVCALAIGLGACADRNMDMYDRASGASKKDYEELIGRKGQAKIDQEKAEAPPIPQFQSVLAAPSAPELADTRRVSLAVTETTPVRDILIELARKAEVDLELDPRISGGVIMSATDRPFIDVIERLTNLAELRYSFEKNVLKVEIDDPYLEQYRMDVLNQSRTSNGDISSSTDAAAAAAAVGTGSTGGGNNKSASNVSSTSSSNFWGSIGENIGQILNSIQSRRGDAAAIKAAFVPLAEEMSEDGDEAEGKGAAAGLLGQAKKISERKLPTEEELLEDGEDGAKDKDEKDDAGISAGGAGGGGSVSSSNFSVNPQAGIITVFANQRQQRAVEKYLRAVSGAVLQQILVEAKVLEISLNDQYRAGIDWRAFLGPNNDIGITTNFTRSVVPAEFSNPTLGATWSNSDRDLSLAAQLVKQFGTVRTLSSPRLTVTNNQTAILKVAQNQIFFDIDVQTTQGTANTAAQTTIDSEIKSVPIGLIMTVQPAVDPVSKRISMGLRPSITRITGFVPDPAVAFIVAQNAANGNPTAISSQIPIVEVREMDSVITMDSGQTVVMGGLMQETSENTREGLPGAMDIPILGEAVSQNIRSSKVTELVVFIRATVVNDRETIADEDIRLYKTFTPDPRPIAF